MWLSKQQKQPARQGEGKTGVVTASGASLTVRMDREVSAPELYGPAGYCWSPKAGDRVLVIKGEGERPCIVGVKSGAKPEQITLEADVIRLKGEIEINGTALEEYVRAIARDVLGGTT